MTYDTRRSGADDFSREIDAITIALDDARQSYITRLSDSTLRWEAEAAFAMQSLSANDYIRRLAASNKQSIIDAMANASAIGVSLSPARKQAYLVPRGGRIMLDISYMGLVDLATASGSICWCQARLVYSVDEFELHGVDHPPVHKHRPFAPDRGDLVGVYTVVKLPTRDYLTHAMPIDNVWLIRDRSDGWKAWIEKKKKSPWVTDSDEMVKKVCVKQASKLWPETPRLRDAIQHLNTDGEEGISFVAERTSIADQSTVLKQKQIDVQELIAQVKQTTTDADALEFWKKHNGLLFEQLDDHAVLKAAVINHRQHMANNYTKRNAR